MLTLFSILLFLLSLFWCYSFLAFYKLYNFFFQSLLPTQQLFKVDLPYLNLWSCAALLLSFSLACIVLPRITFTGIKQNLKLFTNLPTSVYNFLYCQQEIMDELKANCSVFSTLKKTRATYTADSFGQKDFRKFETEKKPHNVESFTNFNLKRRIQFSQTKLSLFPLEQKAERDIKRQSTNPQRKQGEVEIKQKQSSVDEILSKSFKIAKSCYETEPDLAQFKITKNNLNRISEFNRKFRDRIIQVIKEIKYKPKQLACHLNTVFFCRENVRVLNISLIQKEIFKQWRENILLSQIKNQWMLCLQQYLLQFGPQGPLIFQEIIYEDFCVFMSHLTFLIFEVYYTQKIQVMDKKQIIERLNYKTMRYIVTQSSQWQNIIYLHIQQILKINSKCEKLEDSMRKKLIQLFIGQMKIEPIRLLFQQLHNNNEKLFPFTRQSIPRLLKQHYIPAKVKCILNLRVALEQDIIQYQKILIQQDKIQNIDMLEKDPMLTCLVLAILSSGIDLEVIDLALREIKLMLGPQYHQILDIQKCPSYFVDLTSVVEQLNVEIRLAKKEL